MDKDIVDRLTAAEEHFREEGCDYFAEVCFRAAEEIKSMRKTNVCSWKINIERNNNGSALPWDSGCGKLSGVFYDYCQFCGGKVIINQ